MFPLKTLTTRQCLALLVASCLFAIFLDLGRSDVVSDNEGQRAAPPAEMVRTGDYLIPRINGVNYLAKPPLLYWATAGVYAATGMINNWTARLSTSISAMLFAITVFLVIRKRMGNGVGLIAAIALLTSPYVLGRARVAELDVPLSWMTFVTITALWRFWDRNKWDAAGAALIFGAGVALGAAFLLKAPVPVLFLLPAWVGYQLASDANGAFVRPAVKITLIAFALEVVLKFAAGAVGAHLAGNRAEMTRGAIESWARIEHALGYPIPLTIIIVTWIALAWKASPRPGIRNAGALAVVVILGCAVAAPWGITVVNRLGWDYIQDLLHNQVVERTYKASEINSGTPFYYWLGLPAMLAPWGLLLPLQLSPSLWRAGNTSYRTCVITGWLSVVVFSCIAGKEYEYVLPAVAFLLSAAAFHIAALRRREDQTWVVMWFTLWQSFTLFLLGLLAIAGPVYLTAAGQPLPLVLQAWILGLTALVILVFGRHISPNRVFSIAAACVLLVTTAWIAREYKYTANESYREIAQTSGALVRAGYTVETMRMSPFHVYPAFAFYAETPIPLCSDVRKAVERLNGPDPYFFLAREELWRAFAGPVKPEHQQPLMGPYTNKKVILLGNRPLPPEL